MENVELSGMSVVFTYGRRQTGLKGVLEKLYAKTS